MKTPQSEYLRKVAEIHRLRGKLGWSQNRAARRIGRSSALVSRALSGKIPMPKLLTKIQRALERELERQKNGNAA